jgi:hypothetical protein
LEFDWPCTGWGCGWGEPGTAELGARLGVEPEAAGACTGAGPRFHPGATEAGAFAGGGGGEPPGETPRWLPPPNIEGGGETGRCAGVGTVPPAGGAVPPCQAEGPRPAGAPPLQPPCVLGGGGAVVPQPPPPFIDGAGPREGPGVVVVVGAWPPQGAGVDGPEVAGALPLQPGAGAPGRPLPAGAPPLQPLGAGAAVPVGAPPRHPPEVAGAAGVP